MATSHFDRTALPPPQSFYEQQLGSLGRPNSKGWVQARCPFHSSKSGRSFSLNVASGGFFCFGCEVKGGDVLKFVMLRDKLSFKSAAQSLGAWRGKLTSAESDRLRSRQREAENHRADEAARKETERWDRLNARDHLHAVRVLYEEAESEHDWNLMAELLPRVRQCEEVYCRLAGLEVPA